MFDKSLKILQLFSLISLSLAILTISWVIYTSIDSLSPVAIRELHSAAGIKSYVIATGDGSIGQCYIRGIFDKNPQANCIYLGNFKEGMKARNIDKFTIETKAVMDELEKLKNYK